MPSNIINLLERQTIKLKYVSDIDNKQIQEELVLFLMDRSDSVIETILNNADVSDNVKKSLKRICLEAVIWDLLCQQDVENTPAIDAIFLAAAFGAIQSARAVGLPPLSFAEQLQLDNEVIKLKEKRLIVGYVCLDDELDKNEERGGVTKETLYEMIDRLKEDKIELKDLLQNEKEKNSFLKSKVDVLAIENNKLKDKRINLEKELAHLNKLYADLLLELNKQLPKEKEDDESVVSTLEQSLNFVTHRINELEINTRDLLEEKEELIKFKMIIDKGYMVPGGTDDVLNIVALIAPDSFCFSKKALEDIKDWNGAPDELLAALNSLNKYWIPLAKEGRAPSEDDFKTLSGFEVSSNESKATRNNTRFMAERTAIINGENVVATHHLKGSSNNTERALRLYFAYDNKASKILIVRAKHLSTSKRN